MLEYTSRDACVDRILIKCFFWIYIFISNFYFKKPSGPLSSVLTNHYGCRKVTIAGAIVAALGFILSIWATNLYYLYVTAGVMAGLEQFIFKISIVLILFKNWNFLFFLNSLFNITGPMKWKCFTSSLFFRINSFRNFIWFLYIPLKP